MDDRGHPPKTRKSEMSEELKGLVWSLIVFATGILIGSFMAGVGKDEQQLIDRTNEAISECQWEIPRSQNCRVVISAEPVE